MLAYFLRRFLSVIPVLLAVSTIVFVLLHAIPGDPVDLMLGEQAMQADRQALVEQLGLNRPILVQYLDFLKGLITGNWGKSLFDRQPVLTHVGNRIGATLLLAFCAMFVSIIIALPAGILAATKRGRFFDQFTMLLALIGISIPNFWLGPVLILIFSVHLGILPISGKESLTSLILPSITLGAALAAMLSRMTRSSMIEELGRDYVTTARAKGVSEKSIIFKHAFRNALNPIITIIGLQVGTLLAGTIIAEKVFSWPGMGMLLLDAIHRRDYPVVEGCILVISFLFVFINTVTDCFYKVIDPRVEL
ncbi:MAG: glutathione ABC transporter permease GsiC [Deltaproteobacteria bacterium RIFCSPLOWO2_02_FULL_44_10]|nr:MAG: glutathione ABC transporter permease GsiC [Deltaproteobacteria bacterium RIFCSPHIGHO2_02_FULL_44_16]OGQ46473.1 MAG: glutathione ABC transporter permease GsiC [Deltaproteobacteria bacterium RIFCSPLOWO2_02_FULL_44_10]